MKLSKEIIEEGVKAIREKDLESVATWLKTHAKDMNIADVLHDIEKLSENNLDRAERLFRNVFENYTPMSAAVKIVRLVLLLLILAGIVGGISYLVSLL